MGAEEPGNDGRQDEHVDDVEARDERGAREGPAEEEVGEVRTDEREGSRIEYEMRMPVPETRSSGSE